MNVALEKNDKLVFWILISGIFINILVIAAVIIFIKFFSTKISVSLVKLEKAMSKIAETGNMKTEIPNELYSKDEVGRIANVANKMKTMLLEYSFNDALTGGLNTKAYHEELNDIFADEHTNKDIWCIVSDMNNLKMINDAYGHMEGDNAIRTSYFFLNNSFSEYGKTYRIGGDEFVTLLQNCTREDIENTISVIVEQLEKRNASTEKKFSIAFGFGYFDGKTFLEYNNFFKEVDKKMYDNKLELKQARLNARVVNPLEKDSETL